jgi:hypothetical protein
MLRQFFNDDSGVVVSAELVLILTIGVLAMTVGLSEIAVAVNTELNDLSNAYGALEQTFGFTGYLGGGTPARRLSFFRGTTFIDSVDDCDTNTSCELVLGASLAATVE